MDDSNGSSSGQPHDRSGRSAPEASGATRDPDRARTVPRRGTALITGASRGIGRELARLFAHDGYDLVLVARSAPELESLARELAARDGIRALAIPADLTRPDAPAAIAHRLADEGIAVYVLVNNAGVGVAGAFVKNDPAAELAMLQLNVASLVSLTRELLPGMVARGRGRILNVASTAAFVPGPFMAGYYASKAYVLSFSDALASELRGTGVTVTTLAPGPTRTDFAAAKMERSRLFRSATVMDAAVVARAGYRGLMRRKRLVVPGLLNTLLVHGVRFVPRRLVAEVVRRLNERKDTV